VDRLAQDLRPDLNGIVPSAGLPDKFPETRDKT
jgi:hypothetical protein